jgi:pantoate--beta-alanine ligase
MGALHEGHLSLIKASKEKTDITVCSIFVNPTQFNDPSDFEKYPKTIENDILLLERNKTDILFLPSVEEIYPRNFHKKHYDLGYLETLLEGKYRPGHFQGVCQVVHRLLDIIKPEELFLGQKDYQQCLVIKRLIELENLQVHEIIVPTVREDTGLAMSSRNLRLSPAAKEKAIAVYTVLKEIKNDFGKQDIKTLKQKASEKILASGFDKVDYVEVADAETLSPISNYNNTTKAVALAAAHIDGIRLIDNVVL